MRAGGGWRDCGAHLARARARVAFRARARDPEMRCRLASRQVRVYLQKVKHLEYEHKNNLNNIASEGARARGNARRRSRL